MTAERLESRGFRAVEARDSDVSSDDCDGRGRERVHLEETRAFQVSDCGCHIPPRGLRHEERADDRLERRLSGPPTLRAVVGEESVERLLHAARHKGGDGELAHEDCPRVPPLLRAAIHPGAWSPSRWPPLWRISTRSCSAHSMPPARTRRWTPSWPWSRRSGPRSRSSSA